MAILDRVNYGFSCLSSLELREVLLLQDLVEELSSLHKLHDKAPMSLVLEHVNKVDNVWVIHALHDLDLLLEPSFILIAHLLLRDDLHSEPLSSCSVLGFLHCSERALSEGCLDLISLLDVSVV